MATEAAPPSVSMATEATPDVTKPTPDVVKPSCGAGGDGNAVDFDGTEETNGERAHLFRFGEWIELFARLSMLAFHDKANIPLYAEYARTTSLKVDVLCAIAFLKVA